MSDVAGRRSEYESAGLDVADLDPDPLRQWQRWYDEAVAAGVTEPNAMALSTSAPTARRTCASCSCAASTSAVSRSTPTSSSAKALQLDAHPVAAAAFGWLELHRQVRVRGSVERVSDADADAYFASRPRGSRIGAWASPQSRVIAGRDELDALVQRDRRALPGRRTSRGPGTGAASASRPARSSSGRAGRAGSTIACATAARAAAWVIERLAP